MVVAIIDFCDGDNSYIADALADQGYRVLSAAGVAEVEGAEVALMLAGDLGSASLNFIADLRAAYPTPLLVLVERDDVEGRLTAYEAGADDCLSKPFHLRELLAKLRALRRRAALGAALPLLPPARTLIDQTTLQLRFGDRVRDLTKREADLLAALARAGGSVVGREDVLRDAWSAPPGVTGNLVDVYVGYARRKLAQLGSDVLIKSVRGAGFRLSERSANVRSPSR